MGGPYHAASLLYAGDPVKDDGGSIITPGTPSEVECLCQVDVVTEAMRKDAGFRAKDVRLIILADGEPDTTPGIRIDDGELAGNVYSLQSADRDSLGFGWECRGRLTNGGSDADAGS